MTNQSKAVSVSHGVGTRPAQIDNFEVWEEDGMIHTRESLRLKTNISIYKKEDVPPKFVNGRPFLTTVQLSKLSTPEIRMHEWYMVASNKYKLEDFTFVVPEEPNSTPMQQKDSSIIPHPMVQENMTPTSKKSLKQSYRLLRRNSTRGT